MKLKTMDIQKFLLTGWCPKMAHNVLQLTFQGFAFGRAYENGFINLKINNNEKRKHEFKRNPC